MSSSWKLDSSHTTQASEASVPSNPVSGRPTFPATATGSPAARNTAPSSSLVVVLPFVPVTPSSGFRNRRKPSSTSLQIGTRRARAAAGSGESPGTPGLLTSRSTSSSNCSSSVPRWTSTPASSSLPASRSGPRATPTVGTPRRASASAAASPDRASPTTSARRGSFTLALRSAPEVREVAVEEREADGAQDRRHDPEAHHDLGLGPSLHLEVVMDRRHQEDASPEVLERHDLHDDRQRLDRKDPADEQQQEDCLREDRHRRQRTADGHRTGVAHDHLGRKGVVPEESDRGSDQRGADDGEVEPAVEAVIRISGADVRDDGDRGEGDHRDDPRARREAVEPVGEVDAVRGAGDDQKEQDVPGVGKLDVPVHDRDEDIRRQVLMSGGEA